MNPTPMRAAEQQRATEAGLGLEEIIGQAEAVRRLREEVVKPLKSWQQLNFSTLDPPLLLLPGETCETSTGLGPEGGTWRDCSPTKKVDYTP